MVNSSSSSHLLWHTCMKHILFVLVVIVAVVISPPSSAWQAVEVSQGGSQLDQARQFLNNYPTEPFMNEQRLREVAEARSQSDVVRRIGYETLRAEARVLERTIQDRLASARRALNSGSFERFNHEKNLLNVQQQKLVELSNRWDQVIGSTNSSEPPRQELNGPPEQQEQSLSQAGPEVVSNVPPPPTPPTVLGVSLTTPVVVTGVAVAVGTAAAITNNGDDTTDTTGGNN